MHADQPDPLLWSAEQLGRITCDTEFAGMIPVPVDGQKDLLAVSLFREDSCGPLVVWNRAGRLILLIGYDVFPTVRLHGLPFHVIEKQFGTREDARVYVLKEVIAHMILPPLWATYLRGLFYEEERPPRGGDHRKGDLPRTGRKTATAMAEILGVHVKTLRRDAELALDVTHIAAACPPEQRQQVINALLSIKAGLTRERIRGIAQRSERERKDAALLLLINGKPPLSKRMPEEEPATITLPRPKDRFAAELDKRLGRQEYLAYHEAMGRRLAQGKQVEGQAPAVLKIASV